MKWFLGIFDFFTRCWRGQESLAKAYWLLAVLLGLFLVAVIVVIFSFFVPITEILRAEDSYYQRLIVSIMLPFTLFSAVCVWRCGRNSILIWKLLSRMLVILAVLDGVVALFQVLLWK